MSQHVPPSKIRYEKRNPKVSIRLTESLRKTLNELREKEGLSYADLIKRNLKAAGDEATVNAAIQAAYEKGRQKGRSDAKRDAKSALKCVEIGKCSVCQRPIIWDLTDPINVKLLGDFLERLGVGHGPCIDKKRSA